MPQVLARHQREMVVLIISNVAAPQHEDDRDPLRGERPHRGLVLMTARPLAVVVGPGPLAGFERAEGELLQGVAQVAVAREAEVPP